MKAKLLKACPSCGSTCGYTFSIKVEVQGQWGVGSPESTCREFAPSTVTCIDCGYRVHRSRCQPELQWVGEGRPLVMVQSNE